MVNESKESQRIENKNECDCPKILIVDDDEMARNSLSNFIKNYSTTTADEAYDGTEAIQKCRESMRRECCGPYKLVLMDIGLPE